MENKTTSGLCDDLGDTQGAVGASSVKCGGQECSLDGVMYKLRLGWQLEIGSGVRTCV